MSDKNVKSVSQDINGVQTTTYRSQLTLILSIIKFDGSSILLGTSFDINRNPMTSCIAIIAIVYRVRVCLYMLTIKESKYQR